MNLAEWGAITATAVFLVSFSTVLFRLADRLNRAEKAAGEAADATVAVRKRIETLEMQLTDHRVAVAREYVSRETLETLENKLVDAINRLGDRLDQALQRNTTF